MRALVVSPQPFFSARGTPFSVYYRTLIIAQQGVEVDLLTYGEGLDVNIPGMKIHRIPRFKFLGSVRAGPSLLKLWLDLFLMIWCIVILIRRRYDFVHAHEESVFFLMFLKPIFRFKLVYDMHSSLPKQLRNFRVTKSAALGELFYILERRALRKSDVVITICPVLRDYALLRMPDSSRHVLIENSQFDEVRLKNRPAGEDGQSLQNDLPRERAIVAYAGTFESYQGLELLLESFVEVRRQRPDAWLLMIGGRPEQVDYYRGIAEQLGLGENTRFTGRIGQPKARRLVARASVVTSPRIAGTNTPLKIYEQLASGIPLVATRVPSHTQILDDNVCFLVDPEPRAFAEGIVEALNDQNRRNEIVANAKALYERKYGPAIYAEKVRRFLEVLG